VACSTKKNTFLSRNSHALSTKYNILYNGQIGLDKGIKISNLAIKMILAQTSYREHANQRGAAGTENLKILILNWQRQKPLKPFKNTP
jgi:hypothetical protein